MGVEDPLLGADLATYDAALKEMYLDDIRVQFNSDTPFYYRITKDGANITGREVVGSLNVGRSEGYGATAAGAELPDPHNQSYQDMRFKWNRWFGRIKFDEDALIASQSEEGAFARLADTEIDGITRDGKNDFNRMLFGDGSGRLGIVEQVVTANPLTVRVREVYDTADQSPRLRWIRAGMMVSVVDADAGALGATSNFIDFSGTGIRQALVTGVDPTGKTLTLQLFSGTAIDNATAGVAQGDAIVRANKRDETVRSNLEMLNESGYRGHSGGAAQIGDPKEFMGLMGLVNDADVFYDYDTGGAAATAPLQNVSATQFPIWRANVFRQNNALTALSVLQMQTVQDTNQEIGNGTLTAIFCSYGGRRAYEAAVINNKRFPNTMQLDGGFEGLEFNGKPLIPEKDCPTGAMFFLDEYSLKFHRLSDLYWMNRDGAVLNRVPNFPAYEATLAMFGQLATFRRNANGLLLNVQEV